MPAHETYSLPTYRSFEELMEAFSATREEIRKSREKSAAEWLEMKAFQQETAQLIQENARQQKENDRQFKEVQKKISELGDRIGELVEVMVEGGVVRKFRELGYQFTQCARRVEFENKEMEISGELDLFLEDGDYALAVEVKTNLSIRDIQAHVKRLEKYSRYARAKGDERYFLAAVGGGVVRKEVREYALKQGIYVVIQSGETIEIAPLPKGFKAKIW